jgi:1,4-alpha-glucan branching enzyme
VRAADSVRSGRAAPERGALALVLHTHMPYVEGFGTWPFGEEWLWEAMATCYLPLLEVLRSGAPLTLSMTPVLCDQLAAPGIGEHFLPFVREVRGFTHRADIEGCDAGGQPLLARELERSLADYQRAAESFDALGGDLLGALAPYAQWTSSATHAVLPLLATDAGARLQIQAGIDSHRARFGRGWRGGFWLPECAHVPWLDPLLEQAGVRACCVDLTDVYGLGAAEHLQPLRSPAGPLLVPIDRQTIELVWSDAGYPAHGRYRDYHHRTTHDHRPWGNDGRPYDPQAARTLAAGHAADFVARVRARLQGSDQDAPLVVCALDTELLGHWWYEGIWWLESVIEQAEAQGLALARLDDALERHPPAPAPPDLPTTTWGSPRDLSTWDGPRVADLAWAARAAELRLVAAAHRSPEDRQAALRDRRALRELLALQSSDWTFMVTRELAGPYPRQRAQGHLEALEAALGPIGSPREGIRNLATHASSAPLLAP